AGVLREGPEPDRVPERVERLPGREPRPTAAHREDAQAAGSRVLLTDAWVSAVVQADFLEQRDVERVGLGMEELRAEVNGDGLPLVVDHPRVAVPADPVPRL